jgi:hypothetical protein
MAAPGAHDPDGGRKPVFMEAMAQMRVWAAIAS